MASKSGCHAVALMGFLLFIPAPSSGQVMWGVLAGATTGSLTLPFDAPPLQGLPFSTSSGRRTGFAGGVFVDLPANDVTAIELGVLLAQKGASFSIDGPEFGSASGDYRITYLEVPVLAHARVAAFSGARVFVLAGPAVGFKLGARASVNAVGLTESVDFSDQVPFLDIGLTVGGRIEVRRLLGDVRYTHGFRDLADGGGVKNRVISFLAGWRF